MEIKLSIVTSSDPEHFMTDGNKGPFNWASAEDQAHFRTQTKTYPLVVMGSGTYLASQEYIDKAAAAADNLRIVLTSHPERHKQIPGKLEFKNLSPEEFAEEYQEYKQALLVAGIQGIHRFLNAKLINSIDWTVEPISFKDGIPFPIEQYPVLLHNVSSKKLNNRNDIGTKLMVYNVEYPYESNIH